MHSAKAHEPALVECPGCRVRLPRQGLPPSDRYRASGECWALYGELSAHNIERGDSTFLHQLAVDAYGAQHAGDPSRPITTAFSLIGLHLALEHGYTGRQVQIAHMKLARSSFIWPTFDLPDQTGALTVVDVMAARVGEERDRRLRDWAASVWGCRADLHAWANAFCTKHLRP